MEEMMNKFCAALAFLITGFTLIAQSPLFADPGIVTAASGLNIRVKPDSKSGIIITAPFKSRIDIDEVTAIKESVKGQSGVWLKVTFYDFTRDKESAGYAFSPYVFTKKDSEFNQIRDEFLSKQFSIVIRREGKDALHWKYSLRLKNGQAVTLFQNNGDKDLGENDYFICDYFPEAGFVGFNRNSPDYWLVDHQTGRIQTLDYGLPSFNPDGSAYFDWSAGGMFGSNFVIYELNKRIPGKIFVLEETDLQSWDMFLPAWKDSSTVDISYMTEGGEKHIQIKRTSRGWIKGPESSR